MTVLTPSPPLDLDELRNTAEAATPGPWTSYGYRVETVPEFDLHRFDITGEMVADCDLLESDARHIAAFDPPTALALISRVNAAEAKIVSVRESIEGMHSRASVRVRAALDGTA